MGGHVTWGRAELMEKGGHASTRRPSIVNTAGRRQFKFNWISCGQCTIAQHKEDLLGLNDQTATVPFQFSITTASFVSCLHQPIEPRSSRSRSSPSPTPQDCVSTIPRATWRSSTKVSVSKGTLKASILIKAYHIRPEVFFLLSLESPQILQNAMASILDILL
jgi:hypothetical protein